MAEKKNTPLVRDTLKNLGLAAHKSRGQNFLKDGALIGRLVQAILDGAGPEPDLLEIGPGLGALTRPLLEAGARVLAVELDRGLAENLGPLAGTYPGRFTLIQRDILTVGEAELAESAPRFVCGNLPYNISSPLLFWFLAHRRRFTGAVFMLQKEMARRLTAAPDSRDYGRLAAALSLWCRLTPLFDVPPTAFHPRPNVDSAVVGLTPLAPENEPALTPEAFGRLTAAAFAARRQTLLNNLSRAYGREKAAAALSGLGISPSLRAETLTPQALAELAKLLER